MKFRNRLRIGALSKMGPRMTNEFVLWMNSLDAQEVARNESFHSQNHRDWITLHEMEKLRVMTGAERIGSFQRQLTRIADVWKAKDVAKARRQQTIRERVAANPVKSPTFTDKQIEIAVSALKKEKQK